MKDGCRPLHIPEALGEKRRTQQFLFVSDPRWQITGIAFKFMENGHRALHIPEALGEKRRILLKKKSEII
jgi:hypothetical protein